MSTISEERIESLKALKQSLSENIKIFEQNVKDIKKKIQACDEEIKILEDERTK